MRKSVNLQIREAECGEFFAFFSYRHQTKWLLITTHTHTLFLSPSYLSCGRSSEGGRWVYTGPRLVWPRCCPAWPDPGGCRSAPAGAAWPAGPWPLPCCWPAQSSPCPNTSRWDVPSFSAPLLTITWGDRTIQLSAEICVWHKSRTNGWKVIRVERWTQNLLCWYHWRAKTWRHVFYRAKKMRFK